MARKGPDDDDSYAVAVTLYGLPDFFSEEQFVAHVLRERLREPDIGRFKSLHNEEVVDRSRSAWCIRYRTTSEDRAAQVGPGRTATMIMDSRGYSCRHPRKNSIGVDFGYSHRHRPGQLDPAFEEKATRFLETIEFVDF
jgi:hypothetical protein